MKFFALIASAVGLLLPTAAAAQMAQPPVVQTRTTHIVEFDLPAPADASPGAMIVDSQGQDNNRIWFVTRLGLQRVIKLEPTKSLMKGSAKWTSWTLSPPLPPASTGGLKRIRGSSDRRFIFVRTSDNIQRIDTQACNATGCQRTVWEDQVGSLNVSDLAVDNRNNVFTAGADDPTQPNTSYIQRLTPGPFVSDGVLGVMATVTRWTVGGGAGFCVDLGRTMTSFPCLSGVAVHPYNSNLIYYAEPQGDDGFGNIGELNISTTPATTRRWHLSQVPTPDPQGGPVQQPRQLIIDSWGIIWVNTGSGHLVSLDPNTNKMRAHTIPLAAFSDPFGIAPDDDVVGYSDSGNNKVGMVFPKGGLTFVAPVRCLSSNPVPPGCPNPTFPQKPVLFERAAIDSGAVPPNGKVVTATVTDKQDGVFVEAQLDSGNDDASPLGITPVKSKSQGTFFYAVGATTNPTIDRVGFVRLPMPQRVKHPRDDDDTDDGCCSPIQPIGWHNSELGDDDDDGLGNEVDTPTANEKATIGDPAPLGPGQSVDYPVTASPTTLALIAMATADNVLGQITVEIYDALGVLVAGSFTAPGTATSTLVLPATGSYTVRVKNYGMTSITHTPTIVVREPWLP